MTETDQQLGAPDVVAEPGWTPIEPPRLEGGRGSFVSGVPEGDRLRVRYFRREDDQRLVGRAWFGPGAEGPPGHAHGGAIAAVLDEAMGAAAWMDGHVVVAAHLGIDYRQMIPLGTDAALEAWVEKVEGRKVWTRGLLRDDAGRPFAHGDALFLELDPARFGPLLERVAFSFGLDAERLLGGG